MPPKGYVGFEVTPRRKILLQEIMQAEGYRKPQEAVDFALAFAQKFVKVDAEVNGDVETAAPFVPDYINYYVGDASSLTASGTAGPMLERSLARGVAAKTAADWRMHALNVLRNYEKTSMNVSDAIDFALTSYIMHSRSNSIDSTERDAIKRDVRANQVAFRSELTEFRKENMTQQEADARMDGTKSGKADKVSPTKIAAKAQGKISKLRTIIGTMAHTVGNCESCMVLDNIKVEAATISHMHTVGTSTMNSAAKKTDDEVPFKC